VAYMGNQCINSGISATSNDGECIDDTAESPDDQLSYAVASDTRNTTHITRRMPNNTLGTYQ